MHLRDDGIAGTYSRIGEVLAIRRCDVDVITTPAAALLGRTIDLSHAKLTLRQHYPKDGEVDPNGVRSHQ